LQAADTDWNPFPGCPKPETLLHTSRDPGTVNSSLGEKQVIHNPAILRHSFTTSGTGGLVQREFLVLDLRELVRCGEGAEALEMLVTITHRLPPLHPKMPAAN
jgi:carbamoylphosphate synthase large subunit